MVRDPSSREPIEDQGLRLAHVPPRGVNGVRSQTLQQAHTFEHGFDLQLVPHALELPKTWRRGRLVFVNSMSDQFHEDVPDKYIRRVFDVMQHCPQHRFQVLTKRHERLAKLARHLPWATNVWMGVSVESARCYARIERLRDVPAALRFLSLEPLLGPLPDLHLDGIQWVSGGGESGRRPRAIDPEWVREIRDQCIAAMVPFFFKKWGGRNNNVAGRVFDGREWSQLPSRQARAYICVVPASAARSVLLACSNACAADGGR